MGASPSINKMYKVKFPAPLVIKSKRCPASIDRFVIFGISAARSLFHYPGCWDVDRSPLLRCGRRPRWGRPIGPSRILCPRCGKYLASPIRMCSTKLTVPSRFLHHGLYPYDLPCYLVYFTNYLVQGWWAIFREVKWAFILFGVFHAYLLALWPGMLASAIFRYIFKTWSFFACVAVASHLFVVATAIMAVVCRLHFGRGLGHFCMLSPVPFHAAT